MADAREMHSTLGAVTLTPWLFPLAMAAAAAATSCTFTTAVAFALALAMEAPCCAMA
jgi:hypothetical protein